MNQNLLEEIESELKFWQDYIAAWEQKNCRPAEGRMLEALAAAKQKYQTALVLH
jgi:hypothetical protein